MLKGAELHTFAGKHPAGNVGIQIHHIDPVNKGDVVWTVNIQDLPSSAACSTKAAST